MACDQLTGTRWNRRNYMGTHGSRHMRPWTVRAIHGSIRRSTSISQRSGIHDCSFAAGPRRARLRGGHPGGDIRPARGAGAATAQGQTVGRAAHARRQARPAGQLEQRDADAARADGHAGRDADRRRGRRHRGARARRRGVPRQAERPQSPDADQGRRQQGADRAGTTVVHRAASPKPPAARWAATTASGSIPATT